MKMMGYWISFALLAAVLVVPSMQNDDVYDEDEYETDHLLSSLTQEEDEPVYRSQYRPLSKSIDYENGNCGECGISPVGSPTIVNGEIVEPPNRFPWMVSLFINGQRDCGASIISEIFIMTASHCIMRRGITHRLDENTCAFENGSEGTCYYDTDEVQISFLTNSYETTAGQNVAQIIPHPHYQPGESKSMNDIALIRMSETIQCDDYASPICLPSPNMAVQTGTTVSIAGWGDTKNPSETGEELRATTLEMEDSDVCSIDPEYSICLSGKGFSSACFGDSGGPAFIQRQGRFIAIGVASTHSSEECEPSAPVTYTSVSNYVEWIQEVSGVDFEY